MPLHKHKINKKQSDNTQTPPRTSITQQMLTDLGRSVEETTKAKSRKFPSRLASPEIHIKYSKISPYIQGERASPAKLVTTVP